MTVSQSHATDLEPVGLFIDGRDPFTLG